MTSILGIDLGTSSVKTMLLDSDRGVVTVEAKGYDVCIPQANYAEQEPETWWRATKKTIEMLKHKFPEEFASICGIGFSGQMHGIVLVDKDGEAIRPAILWMDQRSEKELEEINSCISEKEMKEVMHNRVFTGFALSSLLWIKKHEPNNYKKIHKIMQPKDYIRFKMTGKIGTEVTDASASLLFDVGKRTWAYHIHDKFGFSKDIFPKCFESIDIAGKVTQECEKETGLRSGIPIVYGAGDQQSQSIGNGSIKEGITICNIGTGGQISTFSKEDRFDKELRTHTFCHCVKEAYTVYGAILCGGLSLKWLKNNVLHIDSFDKMSEKASKVAPGSNGLIYLPYLTGERTPYMNAKAKGMFFGIQLGNDDCTFIRSVMEGVTFALKDSLQIFDEMGIKNEKVIASGGGASSNVWLQIQADIFNKEVQVCKEKEQACLGACIIAGVGIGIFTSFEEACNKHVRFEKKIYKPDDRNVKRYEEIYEVYKELYKNNVELFEKI
ncbi:MAG: xylulokinase [Velocimicrobium sp.]